MFKLSYLKNEAKKAIENAKPYARSLYEEASQHMQKTAKDFGPVAAKSLDKLQTKLEKALRRSGICTYNSNHKLVLATQSELQSFRDHIVSVLDSLLVYASTNAFSWGFRYLRWGTPDYSVLVYYNGRNDNKGTIKITFNKWCIVAVAYVDYRKTSGVPADNKQRIIDDLLAKANEKAKEAKRDIIIDFSEKTNIEKAPDDEYPWGETYDELTSKLIPLMGFIDGMQEVDMDALRTNMPKLGIKTERQLEYLLTRLETEFHQHLTPPDKNGKREIRSLYKKRLREKLSTYPFGLTEEKLLEQMNKLAKHIIHKCHKQMWCDKATIAEILYAIRSIDQEGIMNEYVEYAMRQMIWRNILHEPDENGICEMDMFFLSDIATCSESVINGYKVTLRDVQTGKEYTTMDFREINGKRPIDGRWFRESDRSWTFVVLMEDGTEVPFYDKYPTTYIEKDHLELPPFEEQLKQEPDEMMKRQYEMIEKVLRHEI